MTKDKTPREDSEKEEEEITNYLPDEEVGEDLEAKVKELEDKHLRTYADFDNYRKRAAKDREESVYFARQKLLQELLEVKDHLELALSHSEKTEDTTGLREGVTLTLKQLGKFMEKNGVKEFQSVGEPFDPARHEAIQEQESADVPPGTVVLEFQKGYLLNDKLLRPSRVIVSKQGEKKGK